MAYAPYDRLTAVDAAFLDIEDPSVHMHVGAVAIFEPGPLRNADGAIDVARVCTFIDRALYETPRFRQKLAQIPLVGSPVWVDDPRFNLRYHVRHTALPPPGDVRQLKRLAGRVFSQKLDRGKPLWEMWVVEGLRDGRFALILKAHHCMVDGVAGIDLLAAILRSDPDTTLPPERYWLPQPAPTPAHLLRDELCRRGALPFRILRHLPDLMRRPREVLAELREDALALSEAIAAGLWPTSASPLNPDIGPYRRFDWTSIDLAGVRAFRKEHHCTLNDVVLAAVAGAVGRFLRSRGMHATAETVFRVMVPVSIRTQDERARPGNRVVNFLAPLPVDEHDPLARLRRVMETMAGLKNSRLAKGAEVIEEISDQTLASVVVEFVRLAANQRAYNLVVTNVPGPPCPIYLLGAKLEQIYPLVPLFTNQGLGIALFSYDGRLYWGFNADWDTVPDLHEFVESIDDELGHFRIHAAASAATG